MITKLGRFRLSEIASRSLVLASLVGFFMVADSAAGDRVGRAQKCRLVVGDKELISGGCPVAVHEVGGNDIGNNGVGGEILPFWARVISDDGKIGVAYYNGEAGSAHAHYDLGPVSKVGSCWRGANVEICYENFTELDLGIDQDEVADKKQNIDRISDESSPLNCTLNAEKSLIECDIVHDNVTISSLELNRGRCQSPVPTALERQVFEAGDAKYGNNPKYYASIQFLGAVQFAGGPLVSLLNEEKKATEHQCQNSASADMDTFIQCNLDALFLGLMDPIREYQFGDKLIVLNTCSNLLEWSIKANGVEWVWSVK